MNTDTQARVRAGESAHYYTADGKPMHTVPKKDGSGDRATHVGDARKLGLLVSPTTVLKQLHRQALVEWLIEQACLAVLTAPRTAGESLDEFVRRVLHTEAQQDQESAKARTLGTNVHAAIQSALKTEEWPIELAPLVMPVLALIPSLGRVVKSESVVVGDGYAGTLDLLCDSDGSLERGTGLHVVDFKTCKKVPKDIYPEHRMQVSAYADALGNTGDWPIFGHVCYISTTTPGDVQMLPLGDWSTDIAKFKLLLRYWQLDNEMTVTP